MKGRTALTLPILTLMTACQPGPPSDRPAAAAPPPVAEDTVSRPATPPDTADLETDYYWLNQKDNLKPAYTPRPETSVVAWQEIEPGLGYADIDAPLHCSIGDARISALRIDPRRFDLELYCAGEKNAYAQTAPQWAAAEQLIAVFNAGMFQMDGLTNAGYLRKGDYLNNTRLNPGYKSILALGPIADSLPGARIVDLGCEHWDDWKDRYRSFTQCIRMISCAGKNVWTRQDRRWSMVCVATDHQGNILFLFARSPYSVWQFNEMLLQLPLDIDRTMYLEGGPEASFYINHPALNIQRMGSYETGFNENDDNRVFWELPNVIGVRRRE